MYVCMYVCYEKAESPYSKDLVISPVSGHFQNYLDSAGCWYLDSAGNPGWIYHATPVPCLTL